MSDTFGDAFALLAAAADVKGCKGRIARLKRLGEQTAAAQAKLEADREAHTRTVEADTAAADAREKSLRDREVAVAIAERDLVRREQIIAAAKPPRFTPGSNLNPGEQSYSGLSREAL